MAMKPRTNQGTGSFRDGVSVCVWVLRQQQASALAYFDSFWMIAVVTLAVAALVLLMKRSVAANGARLVQGE